MATTQTYDISPGAIAAAGTPGGPPFALSKAEWLTIQTYVIDALALPINDDEFGKSLGPGAPADLSDFMRLIACYQSINGNCKTWDSSAFPNTVALADAVYEYGANKAPVYYPPIVKEANILADDPNNEQAKAALKAILGVLEGAATDYAQKASKAAAEVEQFATATQADKVTLLGPNGDAGLVKYYNDEYGTTSAEVEELVKQINAQKLILASADAEYTHDVTVAATTPTYAWVLPPIGLIAAAIVAGIYGHKAVEALDEAHAAQDKINSLEVKWQADANIMTAIMTASTGMTTIVAALSAALPVIQKIQGVWAAMAADLAAIAKLIETDIAQVPPIIMSLGVDEAVRAWFNVAQAANAYRVNAYVHETGGPAASMLAWKVDNHIASKPAPLALAA
jgi:hypothetical protein